MRLNLLLSLGLGLLLTACADHSGSMFGSGDTSQTPADRGDIVDPTSATDPLTKEDSDDATVVVPPEIQPPLPGDGGSGNGSGNGDGSDGLPGGYGDGPDGAQPVPEPSTLLLVGSGLAGLALLRRRRREPHA